MESEEDSTMIRGRQHQHICLLDNNHYKKATLTSNGLLRRVRRAGDLADGRRAIGASHGRVEGLRRRLARCLRSTRRGLGRNRGRHIRTQGTEDCSEHASVSRLGTHLVYDLRLRGLAIDGDGDHLEAMRAAIPHL